MRQSAMFWMAAAIVPFVDSAAPAQSVEPEPLTLEVNLSSGRVRILASSEVDFSVNAYAILSPSGSLTPGAPADGAAIPGDHDSSGLVDQADLDLVLLNWGNSSPSPPAGWTNDFPDGAVDQAELDRVLLHWGATDGEGWLAGNLAARGVDRFGGGEGEGWEVLASSERGLFEAFLFGESYFGAGRNESIGDAFDAMDGVQDLEFLFSTVGGTELPGRVVYVPGTPAKMQSVPEPHSYVLLSMVLVTYGTCNQKPISKTMQLLAKPCIAGIRSGSPKRTFDDARDGPFRATCVQAPNRRAKRRDGR